MVESFACYPGPRTIYEMVLEGEEYIIPVWEVPRWDI